MNNNPNLGVKKKKITIQYCTLLRGRYYYILRKYHSNQGQAVTKDREDDSRSIKQAERLVWSGLDRVAARSEFGLDLPILVFLAPSISCPIPVLDCA